MWYGSVPVAGVVGDLPVGVGSQHRGVVVVLLALVRDWTDVKVVWPVVNGVTGGGRQMTSRHVSLSHSHSSPLRVRGHWG